MRWLFLLLLLLNAAFFIWQYNRQPQPLAIAPPPADRTIKTLTLLSEAAPASIPAETCYAIGPFSTAEDAQRASAKLAEQNIQTQQRTDETSQPPVFWLDSKGQPLPDGIWQELTREFSGLDKQACP
ncbi:MAG: hypothetical protein IDH49_08480 [Gammaproteobacteria bacterium]|nr:hypothetical protein [Gammaproteobacteria bacterium]